MGKHQSALLKAIERAGGQEALAKAINVPQSTVSFWLNKAKKGVAAEKVGGSRAITLVPRYELRPGLYEPPSSAAEREQGEASPAHDVTKGLGHFSRFKHIRRNNFATAEDVVAHIRALRDEWDD